MSYTSIDNLYKSDEILWFKHCWCMEKIHGSSAWITWNGVLKTIQFHAGGVSQEHFQAIFDIKALGKAFEGLGYPDVRVYGEVYGGKCQKMSETYGKTLKFVAFEVRVDNNWLSVTDADALVQRFGLEFVHYDWIEATADEIDKKAHEDSVQAVRNGMGEGHMREGVVLRPPIELVKNNGKRIMAKHKRPEFQEREHQPSIVDPEKKKILDNARAIATEEEQRC